MKQDDFRADLLQKKSPVGEVATHERLVVGRLRDLRRTLLHAARLEDLVVRDHRDLRVALRGREERSRVRAGRILIVLPAAPPRAAATAVRARGLAAARGAARRAARARRRAVEEAARDVRVAKIERRRRGGRILHRRAGEEVSLAEVREERRAEARSERAVVGRRRPRVGRRRRAVRSVAGVSAVSAVGISGASAAARDGDRKHGRGEDGEAPHLERVLQRQRLLVLAERFS